MIFDAGKGVVIFPARLQRVVNTPVGKVQEKRAIAVSLNDLDRLVGVIVRQVTAGLKIIAAIELGRIPRRGPHHPVDAFTFLPGIHHVRIINGQVQGASHIQAVVESLVLRAHTLEISQVPFADVGGVITLGFQHFRDGDFRRRHPQVLEWRQLPRTGLVYEYGNRRWVEFVHPGEYGGADIHERGELEAEARRVAPGHDGRAGGGADRVGGVAVLE